MNKKIKQDLDLSLSKGQKARFTRLYNEIELEIRNKIKDLKTIHDQFTTGSDENPSYANRLQKLEDSTNKILNEITSKVNKIRDLHKLVTDKNVETETSVADEVENFVETFETRLAEIRLLRNQFIDYKKELEGFESDTGDHVMGLKDRIQSDANKFQENLKNYEDRNRKFLEENEEKFEVLKEKIESLLPGASTVGIAQSFEKHKKSFNRPVMIWSLVFLLSLTGMILYALLTEKPEISTIEDVWVGILKNLPFFLPAIWIAIYASKQQSQNKRLQQEYAFKEDVAKSYQGFKKEIENLDEGPESNKLKLHFMQQLVEIIGENPTSTLENKSHKDKPPLVDELTSRFGKNKQRTETEKKVQNDSEDDNL